MKKLTFLFIATFILSLAFFSSYFVIEEVRGVGGDINIGNDIDMNLGAVKLIKDTYEGVITNTDAIVQSYDCFEEVCFTRDKEQRAGVPFCITNWCQINDFEWCGENFAPPGHGCFAAETPILMADGKYKPIKDVKEGDWILTKESESSNKMVSAKVVKKFEYTVDSYLVINNQLKVTDIHPIFINGKWKQAGAIKLGDKLLNEKGQEVVIESLKLKRERIKVYNLEIEGYATYFAGGVYVHNKPRPIQ